MKVDNPNNKLIIGSSVAEVVITENNTIKIVVKNKSSLELIPIISDGVVSGYEYDLMTKEDNRKIEKALEKIRLLQEEIQKTKENGTPAKNSDASDDEDDLLTDLPE